jgi:protein involved in polysaccharide export with SLBB domain
VQGEVRAPGIYQLSATETLLEVIAKAGGVTNQAYLFGTQLSRESVRAQQKENLNQVINRLENQLSSFEKELDFSSQQNAEGMLRMQALNRAQLQQKIIAMRSMSPNGRIALELNPQKPTLPEISLEDGDQITIPKVPSAVTAVGAVYNESALIYKQGKSVSDYLKVAGVTMTAERDWIFVARADGTIKAPDLDAWIFSGSVSGLELMPGDTIVVPEKMMRETGYSVFMRGLKDWTQVLGQLGLTAAAIKVLR